MNVQLREICRVSAAAVLEYCASIDQPWMPFPLQTRSIKSTPSYQTVAPAPRLATTFPELRDWCRALEGPDIRVEGSWTRSTIKTTEETWRVNGVRRFNQGFVAVQGPETNNTEEGEVRVYQTEATDLGGAVCSFIPQYQPGAFGNVYRSDLSKEQIRAFNTAEYVGNGYIQVRRGEYSEWRIDENATRFQWSDGEGIGRYITGETVLTAAGDKQMELVVNQLIGQLVTRLRAEREEMSTTTYR